MERHIRLFGAWLILLLAVAPSVSAAQPARDGEGPAAEQQDPQALLQQMDEIQQQLLQIQEEAMAQDPMLQEQAEALQQNMLEAMRAEGFEPMRSINRIRQLERQLQSEGVEADRRAGVVAEVREEQRRLMMAEQAALQHADVQQARDQFMEALLQAMREENARTDELMASLKQKNDQLQEIVTAQAQQQ
jgi:hypothetical protein